MSRRCLLLCGLRIPPAALGSAGGFGLVPMSSPGFQVDVVRNGKGVGITGSEMSGRDDVGIGLLKDLLVDRGIPMIGGYYNILMIGYYGKTVQCVSIA